MAHQAKLELLSDKQKKLCVELLNAHVANGQTQPYVTAQTLTVYPSAQIGRAAQKFADRFRGRDAKALKRVASLLMN